MQQCCMKYKYEFNRIVAALHTTSVSDRPSYIVLCYVAMPAHFSNKIIVLLDKKKRSRCFVYHAI